LFDEQGNGAGEEDIVLDREVSGVLGGVLVCGREVDTAGVVAAGVVRVCALAFVPLLDVTVFTVSTSSTSSTATIASSKNRRRQYTDGGWGPTG
jgi:hypothetical protein